MSRKVRQVPVTLNSKGITHLPADDLQAILRAADHLIMSGGRTLLSRILKGSHERKILDLNLDTCPAFGYFKHLDYTEILARIDWVIQNGYVTIEYSGRLPLLVYTPAGWEIEKEIYSKELLKTLKEMSIRKCTSEDCLFLKGKNRSLILLLLEKLKESMDPSYIHVLRRWEQIEYKKVRQQIQLVIRALEQTR